MKKWMILALAAVLVAAGVFLPEVLLRAAPLPELDVEGQPLSITSQSSSDYTWRMERIAEHYFGEGEHLLFTYISEETQDQGDGAGYRQFQEQLTELTELNVLPDQLDALLEDSPRYRINYYYLFDSQAVSGFRIAEFSVSGINYQVNACMDVESGRLAKVEYSGSRLIPGGSAAPKTSWYDVLRGYAQYLGMDTTPEKGQEQPVLEGGARQYYDEHTADKWMSRMASGGSAWMELRVIRGDRQATVAVYNGGK